MTRSKSSWPVLTGSCIAIKGLPSHGRLPGRQTRPGAPKADSLTQATGAQPHATHAQAAGPRPLPSGEPTEGPAPGPGHSLGETPRPERRLLRGPRSRRPDATLEPRPDRGAECPETRLSAAARAADQTPSRRCAWPCPASCAGARAGPGSLNTHTITRRNTPATTRPEQVTMKSRPNGLKSLRTESYGRRSRSHAVPGPGPRPAPRPGKRPPAGRPSASWDNLLHLSPRPSPRDTAQRAQRADGLPRTAPPHAGPEPRPAAPPRPCASASCVAEARPVALPTGDAVKQQVPGGLAAPWDSAPPSQGTA